MKILFLHGWHSVPGGVKPTYVKKHGHTVINPALDDDDFDAGSQDRRGCVRSASARCDRRQFPWRRGRHEYHQRISPATKMPPRRKKLATSVIPEGRKS